MDSLYECTNCRAEVEDVWFDGLKYVCAHCENEHQRKDVSNAAQDRRSVLLAGEK